MTLTGTIVSTAIIVGVIAAARKIRQSAFEDTGTYEEIAKWEKSGGLSFTEWRDRHNQIARHSLFIWGIAVVLILFCVQSCILAQ